MSVSHAILRRHSFALLLGTLALGLAACENSPTDIVGIDQAAAPGARPSTDFDLLLRDVALRPGAHADIHVRMFVNESRPCSDPRRTAMFVHGINATAASWERFAEEFFSGGAHAELCRIAAIDHAGHGESGLPRGVLFGELMIEDYARTVIETLERLNRRGIHPSILVGHSQGTSTIQTVQQMLVESGTTLRARFRVRDVVFLGTQGPREIRADFLLPESAISDLISSLVTHTAERGTFVQGPPSIFQQLWFINLDLALSSAAPSVATIAGLGWNADVPLFAALQATGQGGFDTPSVDPGILALSSGSTLHFLDFADDPWSLTPRAQEIYQYLTGDASLSFFTSLVDPNGEAVHDYMITHPAVVRSAVPLPRRAPGPVF